MFVAAVAKQTDALPKPIKQRGTWRWQEKRLGRVVGPAGGVVAIALVQPGQVYFVIEQVIQCTLEGAGEQLLGKNNGQRLRTRIDSREAGHPGVTSHRFSMPRSCTTEMTGAKSRRAFFYSLVRLHMDSPSLRLTDAAKSELSTIMSKIIDYRAIASVLWAESGSSSKPRPDGSKEIVEVGPHWWVGFYSPNKVQADEVTDIDGIPFVFVQGNISMRLNDATLDYIGGKFVVEECAI